MCHTELKWFQEELLCEEIPKILIGVSKYNWIQRSF